MRTHPTRAAGLLAAVLLVGVLGACDFIKSPTGDPNAVPTAQLDQLFTTAQVNSFFFSESELSRVSAIWLQQLKGVDRQFASYNNYEFTEDLGNDPWGELYRTGGLIDLNQAIGLAEEAQRPGYAGILMIHKAFLFGMAASVWGAIPYTEAADPSIAEPKLDDQLVVYDAVQALLDSAIVDLETGQGMPTGGVDMNFDGSAQDWIAVAHSLKARFYMHWAEVDGTSAYQKALDQAELGISSVAGNWHAVHSTAATENNIWYQFQRDRSGYVEPNSHMVTLLASRNDPRLNVYFTGINASETAATGIGEPATSAYDQPMVTCAETQFIAAEASLQLGDQAGAEQYYHAGVQCQDAYWSTYVTGGATIPEAPVSMQEILTQKYIALFLNPEAWNDYKRTCLPAIQPVATGKMLNGLLQIPPGLYYPISERQTNSNVPTNDDSVLRNANDPNPCTS